MYPITKLSYVILIISLLLVLIMGIVFSQSLKDEMPIIQKEKIEPTILYLYNTTVITIDKPIIIEQKCIYASQMIAQQYVRNKIMNSQCYKNTTLRLYNWYGYGKGIEITKICNDTYAEGYITLMTNDYQDHKNIVRKPFMMRNDEVIC